MAKHVVILGAGASVAAGAPLMFDFLDKAEYIFKDGLADAYQADFELVFRGLHQLEGVLAKAFVDVNNLESVFGAFEMAKLCAKLGNFSPDEVSSLVPSLQKVILRTLELTVKHQGRRPELHPPAGYQPLSEILSQRKSNEISFITFNYDLGLDHAVYSATHKDPSYGFNTLRKPNFKVLKLHGSMHWYKGESGDLNAVPLLELFAHPYSEETKGKDGSRIIVSRKLANLGVDSPFIVPPTWKKGDFYTGIADVWRQAALELQEAEHIYVCGFSLPETDQYFRYLFALGAAGQTRLKRFVVSDPNVETAERFKALLGPTTLIRFTSSPSRFVNFVPWLKENIEK